MNSAGLAERAAIRLLADVGGDREWWVWNSRRAIGHLRVGLTPAEHAAIPHGIAEFDAGPSGPERPRAYKDVDVVMADAADLVEVRHTLRQIVNVKGN